MTKFICNVLVGFGLLFMKPKRAVVSSKSKK